MVCIYILLRTTYVDKSTSFRKCIESTTRKFSVEISKSHNNKLSRYSNIEFSLSLLYNQFFGTDKIYDTYL